MLDKLNVDNHKRTDERVINLDASFGTDLREVRSYLGIDMSAFSDQIKISTAALEKLEAGDTKSSLAVCKRLQKFLKMALAAHMAEKMKRLKKDDKVKLNRRTLLHLLPHAEERSRKKH